MREKGLPARQYAEPYLVLKKRALQLLLLILQEVEMGFVQLGHPLQIKVCNSELPLQS